MRHTIEAIFEIVMPMLIGDADQPATVMYSPPSLSPKDQT